MLNKTIALDIGGTRIKIASVEDGVVTRSTTLPAYSEGALRDRLSDIEVALFGLVDGDLSAYRGIGIAMPCLVDAKRKRATEIYKKFEDAPSVDVSRWAKECFQLPLVMEQDSKAALLGEVYYGAAKGHRDVLLIIMGTGVGTAVMLNGELLSSRNHSAGALGSHIIIEKGGRKCTCHARGCLEAYTSGWALPGLILDHEGFADSVLSGADSLDFYQLEKGVQSGDRVSVDVLSTVISSMRAGIISLINAYDPAAVILSGGPLNMGEVFTGPLYDGIHAEIWGTGRCVEFLTSENPDESVLLGLHYLSLKEGEDDEV